PKKESNAASIVTTTTNSTKSNQQEISTTASSSTTTRTKYVHPNKSPIESKWPSPSSAFSSASVQTTPTKSKWSPPPSVDIPSISTPAKSISTKSSEHEEVKY